MTKEQKDAVSKIFECAAVLGANVLVSEDENGNLGGVVIGSPHYVQWINQHIPDFYKTTDPILNDEQLQKQ